VRSRFFVTYQMEYENFTHLPGESIDSMFQWFTVIVNNMRLMWQCFHTMTMCRWFIIVSKLVWIRKHTDPSLREKLALVTGIDCLW
jgi:hypothetical protein